VKVKLYLCGGEEPISEFPLGLGYLKSNCCGDITIVKSRDDLKDCDLIGLSSTAGGLMEAVDIVMNTDIPVIIGGQGTMWEGLRDYPFKHIVIGEGEEALQQILDGKATDRIMRMTNIPNLDTLCFPYRGKCGLNVPILSSRGCPWHCYFCSSQNYWGKARFHSAEYFIDEVDFIDKVYPSSILLYIMDDLFIVNIGRFNEIYRLWMAKRLNKRFKLHGFVRSNRMNMDIAKRMKGMGFRSVRFGAESGSNRMLKILNKQETIEDHQRCIDICNRTDLPVCCSIMNYTPGERIEDRNLTGEFIERNKGKLVISGNYRFQPFPGTHFYNGENPLEGDWRTRGGEPKLAGITEEGVLK